MITAEELSRFPDTFNGDDAHLVRCIEALLSLDATGTLAPHGIGGHAHGLLSAAMHRLASQSRAAGVQGADLTQEAVAEAMKRWPDAQPAIIFMAGAVGALAPITANDIAWANTQTATPQPPKDTGAVPMPVMEVLDRRAVTPLCDHVVMGYTEAQLIAYGDAREAAACSDAEKAEQFRKGWEAGQAAGRADAVPASKWFGPDKDGEMYVQTGDRWWKARPTTVGDAGRFPSEAAAEEFIDRHKHLIGGAEND